MFVVACPQVTSGRGQRLVTERRIRGMVAVPDGWLLTVACPCGQEHQVAVPVWRPRGQEREGAGRAQVVA